MKTTFLGMLLAGCLVSACLYGQVTYRWQQTNSGGYSYRFVTNDPMGARFYTLKNGLTVILSPNKKEPRVTFRLAVRSGSNSDPVDHTGLAHYLEHLLFKGTDRFGTLNWCKEKPLLDQIEALYEQYNSTKDSAARKAIYQKIDKVSNEASKYAIANEYTNMMAALGSQGTNAHTWVEETVYEEDMPSNVIDTFLSVQAERFRNPIIRLFHTELEAVYEEKNRMTDNDGSKMQEAIFTSLFPTHNYGVQTTIGTIEHLKNPSIKAIKDFYVKHYVPNNMAIILAGDFDADAVIRKIDARFSFMKPGKIESYKGPVEGPISGPIVKEVYGPMAESMRLVYRIPGESSREALLCSVVQMILSNGKAGIIDVNLNKKQLVLAAGAGAWQYKDYGLFFLMGAPRQNQPLEEVKDLLLTQIKTLQDGQFDESLVKATVANLKLGVLQSIDDNGIRANDLVDQFIKNKGSRWDKNVAYIEEVEKITKHEIVDFARAFFTDKNFIVLYKRKGVDNNVVKVDKPPISPIETNAGKTSPFLNSVVNASFKPIDPVWVDYKKDLTVSKAGRAEVLYVPNKKNKLFKLAYRFDNGSWNNKLLPVAGQYLQLLGVDGKSAEAISKEFYNIACSYNVAVSGEQTIITISGLQEYFDQAVSLFEDLINHCQPDEQSIEGLKGSLARARMNLKSNKGAIAEAQQSYALYGAKNPFNHVLSNDELKAVSAKDLTDLLHSLTSLEHKISYYGPLDLESVKSKVSKLRPVGTAWKTAPTPVRFQRMDIQQPAVIFSNYDALQAEVYWVRNLGAYKPEQEGVVSLFNSYFGSSMGSIVFNIIRESKALAYSTYAYVRMPLKAQDELSMVAYVGCQSDKLDEAVTAMNELLKDLPKVPADFVNAQQSVVKDIETDRITEDRIIGSYLDNQRKGIDHDVRTDRYKQYKALKVGDLYQYHKENVSGRPFAYCIVASEKRINPESLKKYGTVKVVSLEELFGF